MRIENFLMIYEEPIIMKEKICFIICATNKIYLDECIYYIQNLNCPKNIEIEIVCIKDAKSMCAGYNQGMSHSDAKYKVYLHQDVFIQNPDFIENVIHIFNTDSTIGMIGMVGGIGMPKNAVTYLAWNVGCVDTKEPDVTYRMICSPDQEQDLVVDAIDGLIMVTQVDIPWREDLFDDFDFYDVSQSFEMRRAGYKIVVPYQKIPWVIHECNYAKLKNYDKNRQVCISEYAEFLTEEDGFDFVYHKEWEELSEELSDIVKGLIEKKEWEQVRQLLTSYHNYQMKNSRLEMYAALLDLVTCDQKKGGISAVLEDLDTVDEMTEKYWKTRFMLQRIECDKPEAGYEKFKEKICDGEISLDILIYLILHFSFDKAKVLKKIKNWYSECGNRDAVEQIKKVEEVIKNREPIVVYSKRAAKELAEKEKVC